MLCVFNLLLLLQPCFTGRWCEICKVVVMLSAHAFLRILLWKHQMNLAKI